jgi:hypothetical protein
MVREGRVWRDTLEPGKGIRVSSVSPFSATALIVYVVGPDTADISIRKIMISMMSPKIKLK